MSSQVFLACIVFFIALTLSAEILSAAEQRSWTSASGTFRVEAELVEATADGMVILKRSADGQTLKVKLAELSPADQEFIASAIKPRPPVAVAGEAAAANGVDAKAEIDWNFTSAAGKAALKEYAAATVKLQEQRQRDLEALRAALLKASKTQAKDGNLDEAVRLRNAAKAIEEGQRPDADPALDVAGERPLTAQRGGGVYLDDLAEVSSSSGWGTLGKRGLTGYPHAGIPRVLVAGKNPQHSLTVTPPSNGSANVVYQLDGDYTLFKGAVAIADSGAQGNTAVMFVVYGDDRVLWRSRPMARVAALERFSVPVRGVKTLKLQVDCPGSNVYRHTVWLEPLLTK